MHLKTSHRWDRSLLLVPNVSCYLLPTVCLVHPEHRVRREVKHVNQTIFSSMSQQEHGGRTYFSVEINHNRVKSKCFCLELTTSRLCSTHSPRVPVLGPCSRWGKLKPRKVKRELQVTQQEVAEHSVCPPGLCGH